MFYIKGEEKEKALRGNGSKTDRERGKKVNQPRETERQSQRKRDAANKAKEKETERREGRPTISIHYAPFFFSCALSALSIPT